MAFTARIVSERVTGGWMDPPQATSWTRPGLGGCHPVSGTRSRPRPSRTSNVVGDTPARSRNGPPFPAGPVSSARRGLTTPGCPCPQWPRSRTFQRERSNRGVHDVAEGAEAACSGSGGSASPSAGIGSLPPISDVTLASSGHVFGWRRATGRLVRPAVTALRSDAEDVRKRRRAKALRQFPDTRSGVRGAPGASQRSGTKSRVIQ